MKTSQILATMLLISFGSVGAVAFTPGLPQIAEYFGVSTNIAGFTVTWYLVGYTLGQLFYGPLTNCFGSRKTIIIGAIVEIIGAVGCIASAPMHSFGILLIFRAIMAIGAGSGLTLAFILTSKLADPDKNARIISLLTISFAITPGLAVFAGGLLLEYFNWTSSFYLMSIYGVLIFIIGLALPEAIENRNSSALNPKVIVKNYFAQIKSLPVVLGGLLVGSGTCFVYTFAALAPFIAMDIMHMSTTQYGIYNFIPVAGMIIGSLVASMLGKIYSTTRMLKIGLIIASLGVIGIIAGLSLLPQNHLSLFAPMFVIYIGFSFVFGNSSALALSKASDKSNASAMLSFVNMGSAVIIVTILGFLDNSNILLLPILYGVFIIIGIVCFNILVRYLKTDII